MKTVIKEVALALWQTSITLVHLLEAADGGHSAVLRAMALLDSVNHRDMHTFVILVGFVAYDWIRSGDNAARVIKAVRELFHSKKD